MDGPAIACSLGLQDYRARLSAIRAVGDRALLDVEAGPAGAVLTFQDVGEVHEQLASIVAAEAECCSFLELALGSEGGRLRLVITASPEAMPVVRDLAASFQSTVSR